MVDATSDRLRPFVPRIVTELAADGSIPLHAAVDGSLLFADVSGFTALSERLARASGKAGAEELTHVIDSLFGELLDTAGRHGGEMLKFGGDALLLLFREDDHARHAAAAARAMQRRLHEFGRVATPFGMVKLRMSIGVHSGIVDLYLAGPHGELVVAGPAATETAAMEAAADAGDVLLSAAAAGRLPTGCLGPQKAGGYLLQRAPRVRQRLAVLAPPDDCTAFVPERLRGLLGGGTVASEHRPAVVGFVSLDTPRPTAQLLDGALRTVHDVLDRYEITFLASDVAAGAVKLILSTGVPTAQADAEERMVRGLREIVTADLGVPARAGVQRGHVFAGVVGPAFRRTYTVIGDVVNTAARLMARAKPGEVLSLLPVIERCPSEFELEELEPFLAKGKAEPLLPLRVGSTTGRLRSVGDPLPLVGRDHELRAILRLLEDRPAGRGAFVEVQGEAGIGKTRLLDEVERHHGGPGVVRVSCLPLDARTPYGTTGGLLRHLFDADTTRAVEALIDRRAPDLAPWAPLVCMAMGLPFRPTPEVERLDPKAVPAKVRESTVALLRAALSRPALVLIEDVHWADAASAALLQGIGAATAELPLTVLATRRPEEGVALAGAQVVEIGPLGDADARRLLERLASRPLLPDEYQRLVDRAAGNPLFLRELGLAAAVGETSELPDRVETLVARRIDLLDPADREVLRIAAVAGLEFDLGDVEVVAGSAVPRSTWDHLEPFLTSTVGAASFRFRHALFRDAAYAGLPFRIRRHAHLRIGEHLEASGRAGELVERLAEHFAAAGDEERTWRYCVAAGDRARERYVYGEAAASYAKAVGVKSPPADTEERFRVWDSYAYCLQTSGRLSDALVAIRRARRELRASPDHVARFWLQEATCLLSLGRSQHAMRAVRSGLRAVPESSSAQATAVRLLICRSQIQQKLGRFASAREWAMAASSLAEHTGDRPGEAQALAARYDAEVNLRTPARSKIADRAKALWEELGLSRNLAILMNLVGIDLRKSGQGRDAAAAFAEAERRQQEAGLTLHAAVSAFNRGLAMAMMGRTEDAVAAVTSAHAVFVSGGYLQGRLAAEALMGMLAAHDGDFAESRNRLSAVIDACGLHGLEADRSEARLFLAETHALAGDYDRCRRGLRDVERLASPALESRAHRLAAVLAAMEGDRSESDAALDRASSAADAADSVFEREATDLLGSVLAGDADAASTHRARLRDLGVVRVPLVDLVEREIASGRVRAAT